MLCPYLQCSEQVHVYVPSSSHEIMYRIMHTLIFWLFQEMERASTDPGWIKLHFPVVRRNRGLQESWSMPSVKGIATQDYGMWWLQWKRMQVSDIAVVARNTFLLIHALLHLQLHQLQLLPWLFFIIYYETHEECQSILKFSSEFFLVMQSSPNLVAKIILGYLLSAIAQDKSSDM